MKKDGYGKERRSKIMKKIRKKKRTKNGKLNLRHIIKKQVYEKKMKLTKRKGR